MLKARGIGVTQIFILWTFLLCSGICSEAFIDNEADYEGINTVGLLFKEKCSDYPYSPPCHYYSLFHEETEDSEPFAENFTKFNKVSEENAIPEGTPFISSDNSLKKRFSVFRRRNPTAQGYKRGPGFRSWGGKRNLGMNLDKKTKFASWGGKRADFYKSLESDIEENELNEKRSKFVSWGGKRDFDESLENIMKFQSGGGKQITEAVSEVKRDVETPISYDQMEKRKPLWAAKGSYLAEPLKKYIQKQPQFQSLEDKKGHSPWDDFMQFYFNRYPLFGHKKLNSEKKRKFSSWGGKRSEPEKRFEADPSPWKGKSLNSLKTRQIFQNWGGKRMIPDDDIPDAPGDLFPIKLQFQEISPLNYDNEMTLGREKREEVIKTYNKNFPHESRFRFNSWEGKGGEENRSR